MVLDGKVALVTGGSRGVGLAAARGLARAGATVVLVGQDQDRAVLAAEGLVTEGLDAVGVGGVDVADGAAVRALPDRLGALAAVDILVCSAAVMAVPVSKTVRTTDSEWRRVMSVDLDGVFHATSTFVPGMAARRSGVVVALSACLGRMSGPGTSGGLAPYRVAKAGVNALVKNLAAEVVAPRRGVWVDAVCPGHCRTDMGGPDAPRSAEQGADTVVWLATSALGGGTPDGAVMPGQPRPSGLLWEDRVVLDW